LLCLGTLLFPYPLRESLLGPWAIVNVPVWLALFYAYRNNIIRLASRKIGIRLLIPYLVIGLLLLFLVPGNGWSTKRKILLILIYLLPATYLCCDITEETSVHRFQQIWLIALRCACFFMFLCWIVDVFAGKPMLQSQLATFYRNNTLHRMIHNNRFVSYLGHPLDSAGVFLMLLVMGTVASGTDSKQNKLYLFDVALSLFGILACASKAALLLSFILLFYNGFKRKNMVEALVPVLILFVYWQAGISDEIANRVEESIVTGNFSTGRVEALEIMTANKRLSFDLLQGHVFQHDNIEMIAALEIPLLGWAYLCGIVFAVLQYLMYFVYPGLRVLLSGNLTLLISILVLMAYANANNGIYSYNDNLLFYSLNLWLILQVTPKENILKKFYEKN